jgi:hypothetical protein
MLRSQNITERVAAAGGIVAAAEAVETVEAVAETVGAVEAAAATGMLAAMGELVVTGWDMAVAAGLGVGVTTAAAEEYLELVGALLVALAGAGVFNVKVDCMQCSNFDGGREVTSYLLCVSH